MSSTDPLVVLVGPTAVGKTETAILLAERLAAKGYPAEIVSADSRLFYRGMDIGTAKPTPTERARVPHHLIDVADPDETWSLAVFQQQAGRVIADIHARQRLPLLVGGTGQYIRAMTEGWEPPRVGPAPRLRAALYAWAERVTPIGLHNRLRVLDPLAADAIDPRNVRRTIRAFEVIFTTGQQFSSQRQRGPAPTQVLMLGLNRPRPELYARIDARIQAMLEAGFVDEVKGLLARGYTSDLPTMSAIGYGQIAAYLRGAITLENAVVEMKRLTRQFVRRQANWFKAEDVGGRLIDGRLADGRLVDRRPVSGRPVPIHWFQAQDDTVDQMERLIRAWLAGKW